MAILSSTKTFVTSAARTTSDNSGSITVAGNSTVSLLVDTTAASGTSPTNDLTLEWSMDSTTWTAADPVDSFTQITAAGTALKSFTVKAPFVRVVWTIAGTTPSFTFSVAGYLT